MAKLTDVQIKAWVKAGTRFEGKSDGDGLWLRYREADKVPVWRYRYRFDGKQRTMQIGTYAELSLAKARETARALAARVALGYDVAGEKQERKAAALAKMEAERNAVTMQALANEYYERMILGRWKHPDIVRRRIDKDICPALGHMKVEDIKPRHIDDMLQIIVKRGAPSIANDTLRWVRRMFDYGIKRHVIEINPSSAFDLNDAGGKEESRDRALSREELAKLFAAMKLAKGFSVENDLPSDCCCFCASARWNCAPPARKNSTCLPVCGTYQASAPRQASQSTSPCRPLRLAGYSSYSNWLAPAAGYCRPARCSTAWFPTSMKAPSAPPWARSSRTCRTYQPSPCTICAARPALTWPSWALTPWWQSAA